MATSFAWLGGRLQDRKREGAGQLGMSEPLSCEERGGFCAVRTLSERCQNTVRTLSERCQNGQVSVRTSVGAPQTRLDAADVWKGGLGVSAHVRGGGDDKAPTRRCVEALLGVPFPEKVTSPSSENQIKFPSDISDAVAVLLYGMQVHNVLYKKGLP